MATQAAAIAVAAGPKVISVPQKLMEQIASDLAEIRRLQTKESLMHGRWDVFGVPPTRVEL